MNGTEWFKHGIHRGGSGERERHFRSRRIEAGTAIQSPACQAVSGRGASTQCDRDVVKIRSRPRIRLRRETWFISCDFHAVDADMPVAGG